ELSDCQDSAEICVNIPSGELSNFVFNLNSSYITLSGAACPGNTNGSVLKLPVGKHWLMTTDQRTGCADTIDVDVICSTVNLTADSAYLQLQPGTVESYCVSDDELSGRIVNSIETCLTDCFRSQIESVGPECLRISAAEEGEEIIRFVDCDAAGIC